jgi:hypothetical protein
MPKNSRNKEVLILDIEGLRGICNYAHWIPMTQGLYKDYFARNLPGWEWNQIIPVLIEANILVWNSKDPAYQSLSQGLYISSDIEGVTLWIKHGETEVAITRKTNQEGIEDRC